MTRVNQGDLGHVGVTGELHSSSEGAQATSDHRVLQRSVAKPPDTAQAIARRLFDIALAAIALVVFAVPCVVIAIVVKLTSRGPVFYVQQRVGRRGDLIGVLKFRSMLDGTHAEVRNDPAYIDNDFKLSPDDPRITRVGRVLRSTSLDELPQLFNVLRGQMSVVGVRPLLEEELALRSKYDQDLYRMFRPGITGLWQVEGRSSVCKAERVELDRQYLENWSLWGDIKIAARTPLALLRTCDAH